MEKDMNMQDKELDAFFRNKLENAEAQPSANLWANIAAGLEPQQPKKKLMPYLSIAATIIVLVTAGIIFIPKQQQKQQAAGNKVALQRKPVIKNNYAAPISTPAAQTPPVINTPQPVQVAAVKRVKPSVKAVEKTTNQEKPVKAIDAVVLAEEPVLATVSQKAGTLNPVVPDTDVELTEKTINDQAEPFKTKPAVIASAKLPQVHSFGDGEPAETKKAKGIGGLLNALVSKIDKREDKLIEFDHNEKLTGINLGIIKIKTQ